MDNFLIHLTYERGVREVPIPVDVLVYRAEWREISHLFPTLTKGRSFGVLLWINGAASDSPGIRLLYPTGSLQQEYLRVRE